MVTCTSTGQQIAVGSTNIDCPDLQDFCGEYAYRCPNDCLGKGICLAGNKCLCFSGIKTPDCGDAASTPSGATTPQTATSPSSGSSSSGSTTPQSPTTSSTQGTASGTTTTHDPASRAEGSVTPGRFSLATLHSAVVAVAFAIFAFLS